MEKRAQQGFTLYELMITVVIIAVIVAYGVPNFGDFIKNNRMTSTANDLHAAFQMARSEAARAKTNITICASLNESTCGGTWDQGYIVFVDEDGDLQRAGATETVLRSHSAAADGVILAVANNASYFSYASTGLGRGDVAGNPSVTQVVMCDERGNVIGPGGNSAARLFVATPLGRATIIRDRGLIGTALANMGMTCP